MSSTLSHVEFAQAYEQWKNRGWDSSVQAFAEQINDIPNRKRIAWLTETDQFDTLADGEFVAHVFSGVYDEDIEYWLHPELAPTPDPVVPDEDAVDAEEVDPGFTINPDVENAVPYLDN